ncbi:MAG: hypothetical protein IKO61_06020 [Lachnospiraceae bacterium]|nr:hypothetical protein [Lachnospiraceae bacterium]
MNNGIEKKQDNYIKKLQGKLVFRIMAVVCLVIIAALVVAVIITGVTGSQYFLGCLVLMMIVPVLFYLMLWIGRLLSNLYDEKLEKAAKMLEESEAKMLEENDNK